ncbi:GNAT family N-acetyltransferase [Bacillus lacus]|uniref:GNAT family N-acetyltransferase n=1 Tax=Metabacillus lacus TaxID=1983721 RepID=A0A7X2J2Z7_9BACI|nr:GNAT family N-acetyltransferase [Metabacillus lacus]MRX73633.1 GNAT family N-acetyltransferase [Metabacillus lacus]
MIIRNAKAEETTFIRDQRLKAYEDYASKLPQAHWNALKSSILSEADLQDGVEIIAAEIDGNVAGSVVLFPPKIRAYEGFGEELAHSEIRMLAVEPSVRGKGVASALVTECINRTKLKGLRYIGLHTGEFMENAIKLYEQLGFVRIPEHDFEPANDGIIVKAYRLELN